MLKRVSNSRHPSLNQPPSCRRWHGVSPCKSRMMGSMECGQESDFKEYSLHSVVRWERPPSAERVARKAALGSTPGGKTRTCWNGNQQSAHRSPLLSFFSSIQSAPSHLRVLLLHKRCEQEFDMRLSVKQARSAPCSLRNDCHSAIFEAARKTQKVVCGKA